MRRLSGVAWAWIFGLYSYAMTVEIGRAHV